MDNTQFSYWGLEIEDWGLKYQIPNPQSPIKYYEDIKIISIIKLILILFLNVLYFYIINYITNLILIIELLLIKMNQMPNINNIFEWIEDYK